METLVMSYNGRAPASLALNDAARWSLAVDPLTEFYSWYYFQDLLIRVMAVSNRYCYPLSLMMIDIVADDQPAPDNLLGQMAQTLRRCCRRVDIIGRHRAGIAILMFHTNKHGAIQAAERLKSAVTNTQGPEITVNIGIASYTADASSEHQLLSKTEEALRRAKRLGGNAIYAF